MLPLVSSQRPQLIGLVALGAKETDQPYSSQEITALTALARTASISAENVLMFEALQKRVVELDQEREFSASLARDVGAAQERERTRISSEIHDTVLQELGVGLRLLARLRDSLQQALGGLEDLEIAWESLGDRTITDTQSSVSPSAHREVQSILKECQSILGTLLGEDPVTAKGLGLNAADGVVTRCALNSAGRVFGRHRWKVSSRRYSVPGALYQPATSRDLYRSPPCVPGCPSG